MHRNIARFRGIKVSQTIRLLSQQRGRIVLPNSRYVQAFPTFRFYATQTAKNADQSSDAPQRFEFQAEISSLLDIVAKSLYSDKEVFIRELISNASDALEKRRCFELGLGGQAGEEVAKSEAPYELRIETDASNRRLVFTDTGIGMNKDELVDLLGTIAKSGSKLFKKEGDEKQIPIDSIIGQFGVGFYSAFVVSEQVVVTTKKQGEPIGYRWIWNGGSEFEVFDEPNAELGTKIELKLRSDETGKFSESEKVIDIVNKYSYFVTVPIFVNGDRINVMQALWAMKPSETTKEMHEAFFKHLAKTHHPHLVNDRPQYTFTYQTDSPINLRALFYVPSRKISHLEFAQSTTEQNYSGISLYNQRVLIKSQVKELLPHFLRFLIGVVDSEDIPLNLSREMLQNDAILTKIRTILTSRVIKYFVNQSENDRTRYLDFHSGYSLFFKEGIVTEQDHSLKQEIAKLLLFESSNSRPKTLTTLHEYIQRMQQDQKSIYYLYAPSRHLAETSPYFELFKSKNLEVLFISDPADELVFLSMPQFEMKQIESVEQWARSEGLEATKKDAERELIRDVSKKEFLNWLKSNLGSVRVNEIKPSEHQSEHPFVITVGGNMGAARHMIRLADIKEMEHLIMLKPSLHVNFSHPVVKGLMRLQKNNQDLATKVAEQVYDNALITSGLMKDPSQMIGRINTILGELLQLNAEKSSILTP